MKILSRTAPLVLSLSVTAFFAQTPQNRLLAQVPAVAPMADPTNKRVPPEIAPATPQKDRTAGVPAAEGPPASVPRSKSHPGNDTEGVPTVELLDSLSDAEVEKLLPLIKARYVEPGALSEAGIKRATIKGLLEILNPRISLSPVTNADGANASPFKSEIIENRAGYLRLGSINGQNLSQLDVALKSFAEKSLPAIVLDLRATVDSANLDLAAEVCRRFVPKGKMLFTVRQQNAKDQIFTSAVEPSVHAVLVVLTAASTAGTSELIAGVLRKIAPAMLIGEKTQGEAAEFEEVPLSPSIALRIPIAQFVLPGDSTPSHGGLRADIQVEVSPQLTKKLLEEELEKGVGPFTRETERPRLNEAALVAGVNPDLDAMIAAQRSHGEEAKGPLHDAVLQRALDFIISVAVHQKGAHGER